MKKTTKKRTIYGTTTQPRLSVYRTNKYVYAQIVDDERGVTIAGVSEKSAAEKPMKKIDAAKVLGTLIAKKALEKKIEKVVFDRGRKAYHGIVKAFADAAREGGLKF